ARLSIEENKSEQATSLYSQALAIYDQNPQFADADMASVLESYAGFMERSHKSGIAELAYKRAGELRKRSFKAVSEPAPEKKLHSPAKLKPDLPDIHWF